MLISGSDRFIKRSKTGVIEFVGDLGDYLDQIAQNVGLQGSMGIQGLTGANGSQSTIPYFWATLPAPQVLGAGISTVLNFSQLEQEFNNPGFMAIDKHHLPVPTSHKELWHYVIAAQIDVVNEMALILNHKNSLVEIGRSHTPSDFSRWLDVYHIWTQGDTDPLEVRLFTPGTETLIHASFTTLWQGTMVGVVQEQSEGEQFTFDGQVDRGEDDAHETDASTEFNHTAVTMRVEPNASDTSRWNCGYLIRNVTIPQGAIVDVAYGEVVFPASQRDSPRLTIFANLVDNANDFATEGSVTARTRTNASVPWSGDNLGSGVFIQTPDISPIIQEIVNRPGWVSGSNICLIFVADNAGPEATRFTPFNNVPADACKLHIEAHT